VTFENPSRRALAASVALRLSALAALVLLGADVFQIAVLAAEGLNPDQITIDELVLFFAAVFYLAVLLTTVVCFTRWELRVLRNARLLDPGFAHSPRWAVAWWFIPIANLFLPYRVLGELWAATDGDGERGPAYLGAWWGCWLGGSLLGNLAGRVSASASTVPVAQLADVIDLVSNALLVLAALLALRLVADLTQRQVQLAGQRLATSSSSESTSLGPGRLK
jgi:hypothetical protein